MGGFCPEKSQYEKFIDKIRCRKVALSILRLSNKRHSLFVFLTCPPTSHTVKLMFLYSTVSTLNPVMLKFEAMKYHQVSEREILKKNEELTDGWDCCHDLSQFKFV